jgi:cytochrome b subunit of formate dehydrogenase
VKPNSGTRDRIVRHAAIDRLIHWAIALTVIVLLATAFLPILGVEFAWVAIHWWTGLALIALVLFHAARAVLFRSLRSVWIGAGDIKDAWAIAARTLRIGASPMPKPGKYSVAQKLIHAAFAVVVLAASVTGALMMAKVDTPWWERDPYWLSDAAWGLVYVIHGLAALLLITMVMTHVYFAFRPEKRMFLRAMLLGWVTRGEYERYHDPRRWQVRE